MNVISEPALSRSPQSKRMISNSIDLTHTKWTNQEKKRETKKKKQYGARKEEFTTIFDRPLDMPILLISVLHLRCG